MSNVAADKKKPAQYFGTKNSLQRRPAEGALAHRAASLVLHAEVRALSCTSAEKQT